MCLVKPLAYVSTSRVLPNSGPGDGNAASIRRFVICSHCELTDNGAGAHIVEFEVVAADAEHVLVLMLSGRSLPLPLVVVYVDTVTVSVVADVVVAFDGFC